MSSEDFEKLFHYYLLGGLAISGLLFLIVCLYDLVKGFLYSK